MGEKRETGRYAEEGRGSKKWTITRVFRQMCCARINQAITQRNDAKILHISSTNCTSDACNMNDLICCSTLTKSTTK